MIDQIARADDGVIVIEAAFTGAGGPLPPMTAGFDAGSQPLPASLARRNARTARGSSGNTRTVTSGANPTLPAHHLEVPSDQLMRPFASRQGATSFGTPEQAASGPRGRVVGRHRHSSLDQNAGLKETWWKHCYRASGSDADGRRPACCVPVGPVV
jgi:hypothetical protein